MIGHATIHDRGVLILLHPEQYADFAISRIDERTDGIRERINAVVSGLTLAMNHTRQNG